MSNLYNYLPDYSLLIENKILLYPMIYIISAILVSFSNVVIYRLPIMINFFYASLIKSNTTEKIDDVEEAYNLGLDMSLSNPPSRCNECLSKIKPYNNIPIISYIINKGKCTNCGVKYSTSHFISELLIPLIPLALLHFKGINVNTLFLISFFFIAYIMANIDFRHKIIPDQLNISMAFIIFAYIAIGEPIITIKESLINVVISFIFLSLFYKIINRNKHSFGYADVKLLTIISALFALEDFVNMLLLASIIGIFEILVLKKLIYKDKSKELGFAPAILLSSFIFLLYFIN